jgi:hypothetical protein
VIRDEDSELRKGSNRFGLRMRHTVKIWRIMLKVKEREIMMKFGDIGSGLTIEK